MLLFLPPPLKVKVSSSLEARRRLSAPRGSPDGPVMGVSPPDRSACSEPVGSWRAPWPNSFLSSVRGEGWGDRELGRITYLERGTTIAWNGESGASESISQERLSVWLVSFLMPSSAASLSRRQVPRLTSNNFSRCHTETERGHHDFCLSRSHYTDTDPNRRGAGARIEPATS